ncbi:hypothetical protein G7B40_004965 [Aetokthonos hydrillicola Thurmond2011]|jgi:hypothetical protein|uniref:O-antigen polymerase n=1 Tax=Aetokthonos hydrillicola Thurmond2011 TaxID=2712845 RepID=A0AAP5I7J8_9CYAN|nr:hypothetical protein [Aetokthonos hydrillicola]MBO3458287.1 hypothetical protein [Aetokthonos hydrillicola CCALA 1050]MBW4585849.1 hypothetical protein [Aetokthonos hydrillicola CCALA 1050]MDR9893925.1 hypothetical protein [Aetokthonos hydrillicola Thurmond2011]
MSGISRNRLDADLLAVRHRLFSGIFIQWNALTHSEKVVGTIIVLIPFWWLLGWRHLFILLATSLAIFEVYHYGKLNLKPPSLPVVSALGFGIYGILSIYFFSEYNHQSINPNSILWPLDGWIAFGLVLWYIQSKKIHIRLEVVAWSFSLVVLLMILFWVIIHFVWHEADYIRPRSLYGLITNKGEEYIIGAGNNNYLMPYLPKDESLLGMVRYVFFFPGPESLGLAVSFISILSLDLKNRIWSILLFLGGIFVLLLSGTRAVWVALPIVLFLRYLLTLGKVAGTWFLCGLIGISSFVTLSLPPVTNLVYSHITHTAEATSNFRADSTEVRHEIYQRTTDEIIKSSDINLFFGHVVNGELLLPGYATATIGSHSFILGTLLYRSGLLGAGIFLIYWVSLIMSLFKTRTDRPICCYMAFTLFSITFCTMELELPVMPITLICVMLRQSTTKLLAEGRYK